MKRGGGNVREKEQQEQMPRQLQDRGACVDLLSGLSRWYSDTRALMGTQGTAKAQKEPCVCPTGCQLSTAILGCGGLSVFMAVFKVTKSVVHRLGTKWVHSLSLL